MIINGTVNVICSDSNDIVPYSLRSISQKCFISLTPLHVRMEEHYYIMSEKNLRESIDIEISVSIGTQ